MKTILRPSSGLSGNRRTFLKSAGVLALATPAVMANPPRLMPDQARWWHGRGRLQLLAEGALVNLPVEPPIPWVLPPLDVDPVTPGIQPPPIPPGLEVRLRATFPLGRAKDVLAVQIYLTSSQAPLPLPEPPPPVLPASNPTFAYFEVKVCAVELSAQPGPNLALLGRVLVNNPAMFGDLTGAGFVLTAGFVAQDDGTADFAMLGAHVSGNHTTIAPQGKGTLIIR